MWCNVFVAILFSFPEISQKLHVTGGHRHYMTKIKATSKGTRSLFLKSAEKTYLNTYLNMYVGDIDK